MTRPNNLGCQKIATFHFYSYAFYFGNLFQFARTSLALAVNA